MKDYCIQLAKAQVEQIGWKAPLPLFCLLVRHLAQIMWHDVTLPISGNFEQLWFLWQKSPPPPPPLLPLKMRENFLTLQIYPFQAISSNFGFCGRKAPPPQDEGKFFDTRSIHFRQFWATLVFVAEKPPPPTEDEGNFFWLQIYPFQAISSNFGFCGRKAPPPTKDEGKFFDTRSIHFRQFWATLVFVAEKPPPRMREIFWHQIYPFQAILSNFGFCGRKAPPPKMRENFLTPDLSISGNFKQLWFLWQKSPPLKCTNLLIHETHFLWHNASVSF